MQPQKLTRLMERGGSQKHPKDQVIYSLDFKQELYIVKTGYVKRYQVSEGRRVIESIYGPGYFFPLTQVYRKLFDFDLSQEDMTYIYQAMTDVEIKSINSEALAEAVDKDHDLYQDLFYEAGRRLKANINRLASNALPNDYQKIAHQLVYLAEEFAGDTSHGNKTGIQIEAPLTAVDMAEQLNISSDVADAVLDNLTKHELIKIKGDSITITNLQMLKDAYLRSVQQI